MKIQMNYIYGKPKYSLRMGIYSAFYFLPMIIVVGYMYCYAHNSYTKLLKISEGQRTKLVTSSSSGLKFTGVGFRIYTMNDSLSSIVQQGYYWLSSVYGTKARYAMFTNNSRSGSSNIDCENFNTVC